MYIGDLQYHPPLVVVVQLCRRPWLPPLWPWTTSREERRREIVQAVLLFEHRWFWIQKFRPKSKKKAAPTFVPCVGLPVGHWALGSEQAVGWAAVVGSADCCHSTATQQTGRTPNGLPTTCQERFVFEKNMFSIFCTQYIILDLNTESVPQQLYRYAIHIVEGLIYPRKKVSPYTLRYGHWQTHRF